VPQKGDVVTGVVKGFVGSAAKVSLGPGIQPILEPKHLSWRCKQQQAPDYFDVGDPILVRVLEVEDRENRPTKVKIGFRETEPNPWPLVPSLHPPGSVQRGSVVRFLQFGAVVKLSTGFEALLHDSELSWVSKNTSAAEVLSLGQPVEVVVTTVDANKERICLSLRATTPNPWKAFSTEHLPGQSLTGTIIKAVPFGFIVELAGGVQGLIHQSRIPERLVGEYGVGDRVELRLLPSTGDAPKIKLEFDVERIYEEWGRVLQAGTFGAASLPDDFGRQVVEGARRVVAVNYYERNPQARKQCIAYYGTGCVVCGFSFAQLYGDLGEGYIHVHHLTPLSDQESEYHLDPVRDLRPVCANCHAILHKRKPPLSIEELRSIVRKQSK